MDVIQRRFPNLAGNILNSLDDQSLLKYRESDRENCEFISQERFYWIRILKKYNRYFETSKESWQFFKHLLDSSKSLQWLYSLFWKTESDQFWKINFRHNQNQFTEAFLSAYDDNLNLFQLMNEKTSDFNQFQSKTSPIISAAYRGDITIWELLINESEKKNPSLRHNTIILH